MRKKEPLPNEKLRAARLAKCLTQAAAAAMANVSPEAYCRWEYGTQEPRLGSLQLLCAGFGMTAEEERTSVVTPQVTGLTGLGWIVEKRGYPKEAEQ